MQELLDKQMCKPGYTWNDTLKRCLAAGSPEIKEDVPAPPELEEPVSELDPVKPKPKGKKPGAGPGRNAKRTSATGMKQTGTSMGMSMPIK